MVFELIEVEMCFQQGCDDHNQLYRSFISAPAEWLRQELMLVEYNVTAYRSLSFEVENIQQQLIGFDA